MADCFCTRCAFQHNARTEGFDAAYAKLRKRMGNECEHVWEYYYPNGGRCTKCGLVNL